MPCSELASGRPWRRHVRRLAGLVLLTLLLAGCKLPGSTPSSSPATKPLVVMSTDPIRVVDPAAITDAASSVLALNVFQRLMTAQPGEPYLKPDAARDCLFTAATVYTCTLNKLLFFHNGHELTSSDVKFSIERTARLDVPGSSASLLSSLRRIETPDPMTVRFILSRVDTQFGWALASPAASIVDEEVYDADEVRGVDQPIVGSGPFSVTHYDAQALELRKYDEYVGRNPARATSVVYRTAADSAAIEDAMTKATVDVVWRGLSSAAVTRFGQQIEQSPDEQTTGGYTRQTFTGLRIHELQWNPASANRPDTALRQAIATALQPDRTLDSILPGGVPGHAASFPAGGTAKPKVTWKNRIQLTLSYDPTTPDGRDIATQVRTRLEDTGGLSVRLRPGDPAPDLTLVDRKAWTATALAWLQPYLDAPLATSRTTVTNAVSQYRTTNVPAQADRPLAVIQRQAALDNVVLPISQTDERLFVRAGVDVRETSFGPGWQLGLFGMLGD